jgi:hypothetical protein
VRAAPAQMHPGSHTLRRPPMPRVTKVRTNSFFPCCSIGLSAPSDNLQPLFLSGLLASQRKGKPAVRWGRKASGLEL